MKKLLLYRVVPHNGGLVFAEPERALFVAKIHAAIKCSNTWGEFRLAMPRQEYSRIIRTAFDYNCESRPKSTDSFSAESVPGWSDGDYPPWLQQEMEHVIPRSVLQQFGKREVTFINGSFWLIPEVNLARISAVLKDLGWELKRAQRLQFH